ncbi:MAG: hypothetical protein ISR65_03820 [Bacteriovoracaceae bacterium]|nr:hypothetical protein [Bacteriovoracaceae bacterium]
MDIKKVTVTYSRAREARDPKEIELLFRSIEINQFNSPQVRELYSVFADDLPYDQVMESLVKKKDLKAAMYLLPKIKIERHFHYYDRNLLMQYYNQFGLDELKKAMVRFNPKRFSEVLEKMSQSFDEQTYKQFIQSWKPEVEIMLAQSDASIRNELAQYTFSMNYAKGWKSSLKKLIDLAVKDIDPTTAIHLARYTFSTRHANELIDELEYFITKTTRTDVLNELEHTLLAHSRFQSSNFNYLRESLEIRNKTQVENLFKQIHSQAASTSIPACHNSAEPFIP